MKMGDRISWPGQNYLWGLVVFVDYAPEEPMAWIRRLDELGDYHYHSVKVKELVRV